MASATVVSPALVLRILPSGDAYLRVSLLSSERGILHAMQRRSSKANATRLDLFDDIEAMLDVKSDGQTGFLTQAQSLRKRVGIGGSYAALESASSVSKLALANPPHEDQAASLFELATRAFDALDQGAPPIAVLVKFLYLYCREEGYPIREEWARDLTPNETRIAKAVLNASLDTIDCPLEQQKSILSSIREYIERSTHLRLE